MRYIHLFYRCVRGFTRLLHTDKNGLRGRGFTLIELLVAITLFSIIMVSLSITLASGLKAWKMTNTFNTSERKALLGLEKIARNVRETLVYDPVGFEGTTQGFSFCRVEYGAGVVKTDYYVNGDALEERDEDLFSFFSEEDVDIENKKVLDGFSSFSVRYLQHNEEEDTYAWTDSWAAEAGVPRALKIQIVMNNDASFEKTIFIPTTT